MPAQEFKETLDDISAIESRGDELRRSVEAQLYEQTLIPDLRADVLRLLEDLDGLLGIYQNNCYRFGIEKPDIPPEFHRDFIDLANTAVTCSDSLVMAARAFFRNIEAVLDHNQKVIYYETEADEICTRLKNAIFESDLPLERKMHLRYFVERVDAGGQRLGRRGRRTGHLHHQAADVSLYQSLNGWAIRLALK